MKNEKNMRLFELRDKNNETIFLFKIENFTNTTEVIERLNNKFKMSFEVDYYIDDVDQDNYNYVYIGSDGLCSFVNCLTEFTEDFRTEENWGVNSSVEII